MGLSIGSLILWQSRVRNSRRVSSVRWAWAIQIRSESKGGGISNPKGLGQGSYTAKFTGRLWTISRGPVARKKQSREQFCRKEWVQGISGSFFATPSMGPSGALSGALLRGPRGLGRAACLRVSVPAWVWIVVFYGRCTCYHVLCIWRISECAGRCNPRCRVYRGRVSLN
jgi:hypothetical protein